MRQLYLRPSQSGAGYTLVRNDGESYIVPSEMTNSSSLVFPPEVNYSGRPILKLSRGFVRGGQFVRSTHEVKDAGLLEDIAQQVAVLTILSSMRES